MDWKRFRELYSSTNPADEYWGDEEDGTWKRLEKVPVGVPQLHPSNELPWFTKVDADYDYETDSYGFVSGNVWMVVSYGTPDGTEAYIKISGWANSYGELTWDREPVRVERKTKTEVFYE